MKVSEKGIVKTGKAEIKYFRFGTGKKQMVILPGFSVHGVSAMAELIASSFRLFAGDYTVTVIDRRTEVPRGYTIRDMALDAADAMDVLGIRDAYIYAVSMGGMAAQVLACERPDLVKKMMLGSTTSRIGKDAGEALSQWERLLENGNTDGFLKLFCEYVYSPEFNAKFGEEIRKICGSPDGEDLIYLKAIYGENGFFSVYDDLERIKCDLLVIGASEDRIFGAEASREISGKTGGELYIYEGMSHAVYDEAPDYRERVKRFFDEP